MDWKRYRTSDDFDFNGESMSPTNNKANNKKIPNDSSHQRKRLIHELKAIDITKYKL